MTAEPAPVRRPDALMRGHTDGELRALYTRQGWTQLRPGFYLPPGYDDGREAADVHRELIRASVPALSPDAVVSHQSASVMHPVPVWDVPLDRVHVTRNRANGGRRSRQLHVHSAPFDETDVVEVAGVRVFAVERAFADVARTVPLEQAIVIGDAALRTGSTKQELLAALSYAEKRPGHRRAVRAIEMLDGRSESVGESRSRVVLAELDGPTPELQTSFLDHDGHSIGRGDFFFEEFGVIGEFDGRVKYGKYLRPGEDAGEAVYREKLREDRLRDMGWIVVRWTWAELQRPHIIRARLQKAFERRALVGAPVGVFILAA
jgi:hypothetical protein